MKEHVYGGVYRYLSMNQEKQKEQTLLSDVVNHFKVVKQFLYDKKFYNSTWKCKHKGNMHKGKHEE